MIDEIKTFEQRKEELVKQGKEKGFITYEELAKSLKGLDLDSDSLDDLYNAFSENNIAIVSEDDDNDGGADKLLLIHALKYGLMLTLGVCIPIATL